jgi:hypothetical protein
MVAAAGQFTAMNAGESMGWMSSTTMRSWPLIDPRGEVGTLVHWDLAYLISGIPGPSGVRPPGGPLKLFDFAQSWFMITSLQTIC